MKDEKENIIHQLETSASYEYKGMKIDLSHLNGCNITEVGMSDEIDGQCEVTRYMFDKPIVVKSDGMLIIKGVCNE